MKRVALAMLCALSGAAQAHALTVSDVVTYGGSCEPSGAVLLPDGRYLVANDEDNVLRVYDPAAPGGPVAAADVSADLGLDPNDDDESVDFEGATWLGDTVFVIGSHGRSRKGNWRPSRAHLIALAPKVEAGADEIGKPVARFDGLIPLLESLDEALKAAIGPHGVKVEDLAGERHGLNIEGLAASADGDSLVIGLRNPLAGGKARLLRLTDARAILGGGQPGIEKLAELDLGGRGVRSIEYSPDRHEYVIAAGPTGDDSAVRTFSLYLWKEGDPGATEIPGAAEALAGQPDFAPEVLMIAKGGRTLHLLSDDGDSCNEQSPSFRGMDIGLD